MPGPRNCPGPLFAHKKGEFRVKVDVADQKLLFNLYKTRLGRDIKTDKTKDGIAKDETSGQF